MTATDPGPGRRLAALDQEIRRAVDRQRQAERNANAAEIARRQGTRGALDAAAGRAVNAYEENEQAIVKLVKRTWELAG